MIALLPATPHPHDDFSNCCCADPSEPMPMAACGCRTCPTAPASASLIADFSKVQIPAPNFQAVCWPSSALVAEARFAKPPTPPPRDLA
ncbi:MAG: hypothetical protein NTW41_03575 [Verrucomicrobia bacterium]|nr:hypothetical protein [Verrucomicrobiota bacterium]